MASPGALVITVDETVMTFDVDQTITIGRDETATIVIDNQHVSRAHGELRHEQGQWVYRDLYSTGGSLIEGHPVTVVVINRALDLEIAPPGGVTLRLEPQLLDSTDPKAITTAATIEETITVRTGSGQKIITIGRDESNDVVVDDLMVSRKHAIVRQTSDGMIVGDLFSRNGTFVNGQRIRSADIGEDDVIAVGRSRFRLVGDHLVRTNDDGPVTFGATGVSYEVGDGLRLVDNVSFELPERSLMAIVGPSGAGKSSLLGVLSGLRDPAAGQVLYQGRDLHVDGEELTRRIGFVPQADLLHDGLTVRASLRYTEQLRLSPDTTDTERDQRIDEVLAQLGMSHRAESRIDRLSGGERKRVNVATELLTEPSLLLLDEPASGLDAGLERTLMRLLRSLADAGRTIIVVTHSLDSLDLCDRLLVLAPGGVPAYIGHPAGVADRFGHNDLVDTFTDLATIDTDWRDPRIPIAEPASDRPGPRAATTPSLKAGRGQRRTVREWFAQVGALSHRFVSVLASDKRNLMLLLAQAPILGVLMLIAMPTNELSVPAPTQIRFVSTAGLVLFVVLLGSTWLGANNAIREIANERALFLRERAAGLSSTAYVASKALVLGVFTAVQSAVLLIIAIAAQDGPVDAVVLGNAHGELIAVVALAGVASMALSLLISAIVGTPDRATTLLPIVLILQFVLSAGGVLPEIVDKPVLREVANLSSSQWGFAGSASTADLNRLQAFTDQLRELREVDAADPGPALEALAEPFDPPARWAHTPSAWFTSIGALIVLTLAPLGASVIVLRRKEPLP